MPFKEKPNKQIHINKKKTVTLDSKHNEKLKEFENDKNKVIPQIKKQIQKLENRLKDDENR